MSEVSAADEPGTILGERHRFTWKDLQRLNHALTLAADSAWYPALLRDNLFAVVRFALNPANSNDGLAPAEEISVLDFYHGHLRLPVGDTVPAAVANARRVFENEYAASQSDATRPIPGESARWSSDNFPYGSPTAENRAALREADARARPAFKNLVELVVAEAPRSALGSYHTRERRPQEIADSWTHRNLILPVFPAGTPMPKDRDLRRDCIEDPKRRALNRGAFLLDEKPAPGVTPQTGVEAADWPLLMNFAFLISARGEVFVRPNGPALVGLEF